MLASELAMVGVGTCVIERLEKPVPHSKALTAHPRTLELLEMRGILERFVSKGSKIPSGHFSMLDTRLDFSGLDTSCPYTLLLPQSKTEKPLEDHARRLGTEVFRGAEALSVTQNGEAVQTIFKDRDGSVRTITSKFAVGADGAGSTVRKQAKIEFPGTDSTVTGALGDVALLSPCAVRRAVPLHKRGRCYDCSVISRPIPCHCDQSLSHANAERCACD